ncbi:DUF262 domain-containing protein [Pseudarthrobacter sp. L1SW]|uniref:DUF262 domain-containing protein n=1 Tax=Pseudarthrobacter sp. L1SW TaxID=2851598 RepID=UPI001E3B03F4|nr:DUF262 domain-containing protein [Pseudarthrobacter sp. L1SW]UEL29760.1 DUF262 domain-containing protein [Pseudarthrobacter sp. L1SW]
MGKHADQPARSEATIEPRLVMKGDGAKPFIQGEFFVAAYQRGYRWGREEVRQLLEDIKAHKGKAGRGEPTDYYLQPIVVLKRDGGSWELVDGQQRLTTLFLITKYVAKKIAASKLDYLLTYETRPGSRDFLETLDFSRRDENIDFYHIAQAYEVIGEWFDEQPDARQAAIDLHTALVNWVYVIWYEAPPGTDASALFTRLNRDHIPLTDSELIKALVLSNSGAAGGKSGRQQEIAAQWDRFERDLRDPQFWAFLTRSSTERSTHIDFLFESMTPKAGLRERPRYWTFSKVQEDIERVSKDIARRTAEMRNGRSTATAAFWRDVVERHGLLTGWFQDRCLYHRIGYLIQIGDSIQDLIDLSRSQTHSTFREALVDRTRQRLDLTANKVSLLRYGKDNSKCTHVLLLMNVETVLGSSVIGSRFSFHAYVDNWSLEHIHAQNSEAFEKEAERRDWLRTHKKKIEESDWPPDQRADVEEIIDKINAHLAMADGKTDERSFDWIFRRVLALFSAPGTDTTDEDMHGLGNLALLQRDLNSKLNNAVFALKREQVIALDQDGAYILPCTRNVFLKYYTAAADQQISLWGPQDLDNYRTALIAKVEPFLLANSSPTDKVHA